MGPISGKFGVAWDADTGPFSTLRNWRVSISADTKAFVASNTKGGHGRRAGFIDWNGTAEQYTGIATRMPGDIFHFKGYIGPRDMSTWGQAGPWVEGLAIVDRVTINVNWETNEIILITTAFSGIDELHTGGADSFFADTTPPEAYPASAAKFMVSGWTSGTPEWEDVCTTQAVLNIVSANPTIMNSCSNGFVSRVPGNIDWDMSITLQAPDVSEVAPLGLVPNQFVGVRLYINPTQYYELLWAIVKEFADFTVNRETGDIVSYSIPLQMSVDGGPLTGAGNTAIILPNGVTWFPDPNA